MLYLPGMRSQPTEVVLAAAPWLHPVALGGFVRAGRDEDQQRLRQRLLLEAGVDWDRLETGLVITGRPRATGPGSWWERQLDDAQLLARLGEAVAEVRLAHQQLEGSRGSVALLGGFKRSRMAVSALTGAARAAAPLLGDARLAAVVERIVVGVAGEDPRPDITQVESWWANVQRTDRGDQRRPEQHRRARSSLRDEALEHTEAGFLQCVADAMWLEAADLDGVEPGSPHVELVLTSCAPDLLDGDLLVRALERTRRDLGGAVALGTRCLQRALRAGPVATETLAASLSEGIDPQVLFHHVRNAGELIGAGGSLAVPRSAEDDLVALVAARLGADGGAWQLADAMAPEWDGSCAELVEVVTRMR